MSTTADRRLNPRGRKYSVYFKYLLRFFFFFWLSRTIRELAFSSYYRATVEFIFLTCDDILTYVPVSGGSTGGFGRAGRSGTTSHVRRRKHDDTSAYTRRGV